MQEEFGDTMININDGNDYNMIPLSLNDLNFNVNYSLNNNIQIEQNEEEEEEEEEINNKIKKEEEKEQKCSLNEHKEIKANIFCPECKIYMCNKCENLHSQLFNKHHQYNTNKKVKVKDIFNGICKERNHFDSLAFFCNNHNQLCCAACISKIKIKGYGKHKDCEIYSIKKIKNKKKNKLNENITYLEELSKILEESINKLKKLYEKINENKEKLKINIQKIFTKIRNALNEREDKILLEVDNKFDNLFFKEELIKESEKLPNIIKTSLERGKIKDDDWKDKDKLNSLINDCINIENNINDINTINKNIKRCNSIEDLNVQFNPQESEINKFLETIKKFGSLNYKKNKFNYNIIFGIK